MSRADGVAPARVRDAAPIFAALGDETRLRLLLRLADSGPASIARLSARARVSRQAITKHVDVLSRAGLVKTRRRGRERICELRERRLADAHRWLDLISHRWDEALDRLKTFVEG